MCGITGFWDTSRQISNDKLAIVVEQMSNSLIYRGPDDKGSWVDTETGIALGHRRLAIVDLSPQGHQPMISADGRYVIVFNGEIYNFLELRQQLESLGQQFRGHSDTEVMLAGFCQWGMQEATKRFNGMFAFALWDRSKRVLYLGRDRLGEKPLYYGWVGRTFLFGSELKALKAHPDFQPEINRDALALFLRYSYIPQPFSIYKGIYKLPPATLLCVDGNTITSEPIAYWSLKEAAEAGVSNPFTGSETEAVDQLEALLKDAVAMRMIADVPLGAFLSGGIDSSTIVALMQAQSSQKVKTFSIGFYEEEYNEAQHAKAVAQHLGCDHTELYVTAEQTRAVIPKLPDLYDEPFSDASQIPTYLVSQLARNHVTVSLSGDAGDELFGGYTRYLWSNRIWQKLGWIPQNMRHLLANGLTGVSSENWNRAFASINPFLPTKFQQPFAGYKLHKLAEILAAPDPDTMYTGLVSRWKQPETVVIGSSEPNTVLSDRQSWADLPDFTQRMMFLDMLTYLPEDILVKVDRASMGVSLEGRIPFLDHRAIEFAWRIPMSMKIREGEGKWLLRQVLYKYVPQQLIDRPKMGFGVPIDKWLRGSLRDWAEELLDETRLRQEGFFNPQQIRQKWEEHLSGKRDWEYHLWDVLMFQAWLEKHY
ncbi:asparagine synthase, glutamine-hydrolyzing [Rivularia sp. PCC 7116]|uniref:asparagine synthase (glutamine-hydrolyzing) n=1 Tax=Rivularia sp. PCC 7116 TaxID=373994 RepID=UPI00029EDC3C|nr:asparagine synthase (glutamine-hydrolyzing) [Rivularia sp. PCC 7116]AFY52857.1 asparagine synthase, glutamine-hydrolyzing [Rivularia sp. PCC 7116]